MAEFEMTVRLLETFSRKAVARRGMSLLRSRSRGTFIWPTARRKYRSDRKVSLHTQAQRSRLVATTNRASTRMLSLPPTGLMVLSCIARRSFACNSRGNSPTSSKKMVPPLAATNGPVLLQTAPVKAPRTCPKNSDSMRLGETAAQSTGTNGSSRRGPALWMALATSSFPVPVSPSIVTQKSPDENRSIREYNPSIGGELPIIPNRLVISGVGSMLAVSSASSITAILRTVGTTGPSEFSDKGLGGPPWLNLTGVLYTQAISGNNQDLYGRNCLGKFRC